MRDQGTAATRAACDLRSWETQTRVTSCSDLAALADEASASSSSSPPSSSPSSSSSSSSSTLPAAAPDRGPGSATAATAATAATDDGDHGSDTESNGPDLIANGARELGEEAGEFGMFQRRNRILPTFGTPHRSPCFLTNTIPITVPITLHPTISTHFV